MHNERHLHRTVNGKPYAVQYPEKNHGRHIGGNRKSDQANTHQNVADDQQPNIVQPVSHYAAERAADQAGDGEHAHNKSGKGDRCAQTN